MFDQFAQEELEIEANGLFDYDREAYGATADAMMSWEQDMLFEQFCMEEERIAEQDEMEANGGPVFKVPFVFEELYDNIPF